jgi:TDG/mug DNA glycosylase family protein
LELPALYRIGNTNLVARSTVSQANLMRGEMEEKVDLLEEKLRQWKPEVVCLVGKGPWDSVYKAKHGRTQRKEDFHFGFQDERENLGRTPDWGGSRVFASPSTSGLAQSPTPEQKVALWKELGDWVVRRRGEIAGEGAAANLAVDDIV